MSAEVFLDVLRKWSETVILSREAFFMFYRYENDPVAMVSNLGWRVWQDRAVKRGVWLSRNRQHTRGRLGQGWGASLCNGVRCLDSWLGDDFAKCLVDLTSWARRSLATVRPVRCLGEAHSGDSTWWMDKSYNIDKDYNLIDQSYYIKIILFIWGSYHIIARQPSKSFIFNDI